MSMGESHLQTMNIVKAVWKHYLARTVVHTFDSILNHRHPSLGTWSILRVILARSFLLHPARESSHQCRLCKSHIHLLSSSGSFLFFPAFPNHVDHLGFWPLLVNGSTNITIFWAQTIPSIDTQIFILHGTSATRLWLRKTTVRTDWASSPSWNSSSRTGLYRWWSNTVCTCISPWTRRAGMCLVTLNQFFPLTIWKCWKWKHILTL